MQKDKIKSLGTIPKQVWKIERLLPGVYAVKLMCYSSSYTMQVSTGDKWSRLKCHIIGCSKHCLFFVYLRSLANKQCNFTLNQQPSSTCINILPYLCYNYKVCQHSSRIEPSIRDICVCAHTTAILSLMNNEPHAISCP